MALIDVELLQFKKIIQKIITIDLAMLQFAEDFFEKFRLEFQ